MSDVLLTTIAIAAANEGRIPVDVLLGRGRSDEVARIRHAGILAARRLRPDASLPRIARAFCRLDHSTVVNSIRRGQHLETISADFRGLVAAIADRALRGDVISDAEVAARVQAKPPPPKVVTYPRAIDRPDDPPEVREFRAAGQKGTDKMLARLLMLRNEMEAAE